MSQEKDQNQNSQLNEAKYAVTVDTLPKFYMDAESPGKVAIALRKLLKKSSSIIDIERVTTTKMKQDYRERVVGKDTKDELDEQFIVKYAKRKTGPIKQEKFKKLDDAKEFLATVRAAGMNGLISKNGKPIKEAAEDKEPASPDEMSMALKQAEYIGYVAREVKEHLQGKKEFPEWMQNKLTKLHTNAESMHSALGSHGPVSEQVLAHGGRGQYKAVRKGGVIHIMYKGKKVGSADFDRGADAFFANVKGVKGQPSFDTAQELVDYFAKKKITEEIEQIDEKSVSKAQQKLMAMALAYKRGEMDDASDTVKNLAKSMSEKDLEDFAKTKHKGLPDKVEESEMKNFKEFVAEKKELSPAQKKHLDQDNDGDIDGKDFEKLRSKKKKDGDEE